MTLKTVEDFLILNVTLVKLYPLYILTGEVQHKTLYSELKFNFPVFTDTIVSYHCYNKYLKHCRLIC